MRFLSKWSADSPVAANLIMLLILIGGLMAARNMNRELIPSFDLDRINISVPYPGASPEEVEEGITIKIEEQIEAVEGVKEITSTSREGLSSVAVELELGADADDVYNDLKNELDQITTFPDDAEEVRISKASFPSSAVFMAFYGPEDRLALRAYAEELRDELVAEGEVTEADLVAELEYEIIIEIPEATLERYGLTLDAVSRAISQATLDLPAGTIDTQGGEILVRAKGQRYTGDEFADIPIVTSADGALIRLGEIADIRDAFEEEDRQVTFDNKPAVILQIQKTETQDILNVVDAVKDFVERKREDLPPGIEMEVFMDRSEPVRDRISLLVRNGLQGLILVFLSLWLFLRFRLAFWVAMGIPISFMGAFIILSQMGLTINMLSLFAFIMTLGIVVDDAIIVGENIYSHFQKNDSAYKAAVEGTAEVTWPVTLAVATTIVAFSPMLFVTGTAGKFFEIIPMVVIAVLSISLLEAFLILPAHLSESLNRRSKREQGVVMSGWRHRMTEWLIHRMYLPVLRITVRWRYVTVFVALAMLIATVGLFVGGRVKFVQFERIDSDFIQAQVIFPLGTPVEVTEQAAERMKRGLEKVSDQVRDRLPEGMELVRSRTAFIGASVMGGGGGGSHSAQILVEIVPMQYRQGEKALPAREINQMWREAVGPIAGAERVSFGALGGGPRGTPIEIQLMGNNFDNLEKASDEIQTRLATYEGVFDIRDDFSPGKKELKFNIRPEAKTLGVSLSDLARQVRQAFFGAEPLRVQRGRNEIRVRVQYPEDERQYLSKFEDMKVVTASGDRVPLAQVAEVEFGRGYSVINRSDRRRIVTVSADLDETKGNAEEIVAEMNEGFLQEVTSKYEGLIYSLEGQVSARQESMGSLKVGFIYALLAIFCLLGTQFRSYVQPLIIMFGIPISLIGVILGHYVLGISITLISVFGIVALAGIVVNDALVLLDFINRRFVDNPAMDVEEAALSGGQARFRAIVLTSMTTIAGLLPIMAEKSMQAQFLKPMAVSLAFGLFTATILNLLVTPALYMIVADIKKFFGFEPVRVIEKE